MSEATRVESNDWYDKVIKEKLAENRICEKCHSREDFETNNIINWICLGEKGQFLCPACFKAYIDRNKKPEPVCAEVVPPIKQVGKPSGKNSKKRKRKRK